MKITPEKNTSKESANLFTQVSNVATASKSKKATSAKESSSATFKTDSSNSNPKKSTSQNGSFLQSILASIQNSFAQVGEASSAVEKKAVADKKAGKGVKSGLDEFMQGLKAAFDQLSASAKKSGIDLDSAKLSDSQKLQSVGKLAQSQLFKQISNDAFAYINETLDLPEEVQTSTTAGTKPTGNTTKTPSATDAGAGASATAANKSSTGMAETIIGGLGAAQSIYSLFEGWGQNNPTAGAMNGFAAGAYIGSRIAPGSGTLIGGALGAAIGLISGFVKTGKHADQIARDQVRANLQQAGVVDAEWRLSLANGVLYDIGKDGGFKLTNTDGSTRHAYDVDFGNPLAGEVVSWVNPLAALITGGNKKLTSDFAGYFTNAVLSNSTTIEEARVHAQALFGGFKLSLEDAVRGVVGMAQGGQIDQPTAEAYVGGFAALFSDQLEAAAA